MTTLEKTDDFHKSFEYGKAFAKPAPIQKGQIFDNLKAQGEVVGMLGDGINDAVAIRKADAGISVNAATNVAKASADIILVNKDLSIIIDCVVIGRAAQGNT